MQIHGTNFVGSSTSSRGNKTFKAFDPHAGREIEPPFFEATAHELDEALDEAESAAGKLSDISANQIVRFLGAIRDEVGAIGDALIERAAQETGLDSERLKGERSRTLNQIGLF